MIDRALIFDDKASELPPGINSSVRRFAANDVLRLEWKNNRIGRDKSLVGFFCILWCLFAVGTLMYTCLEFLPKLVNLGAQDSVWDVVALVCWLCGAAALNAVTSYFFVTLSWFEWVEISNESCSFGASGFLAPKPTTIAMADVQKLHIGRCGPKGEEDTFLGLFFVSAKRWNRWGTWLAPQSKIAVFELIEEFVGTNRIPLQLSRDFEMLRYYDK